ncbi:MAG: phosphosulfolactate synthase [Candidatus Magnetoovum sp. WYHC-5]|nr:phosphosulfolactate synthase [Candidatus Magnetoovum sp. WYHC-5]
MLKLPPRQMKPRDYGLTAIMDLGLPISYVEGLLDDYGDYIDIAKLGIGTAYITPKLKEKVALYRRYNIDVCFGGTLFEKFYINGKTSEYFRYVEETGANMVEIAEGVISISIKERLEIVSHIKSTYNGLIILSEVGNKDDERAECMDAQQWISEIRALKDAGCSHVILEGRATGKGGIFNKTGAFRGNIFNAIAENIDCHELIIEAPTLEIQAYFINRLGPNVNLGNVVPNDILLLESLRHGLKVETFFLNDNMI